MAEPTDLPDLRALAAEALDRADLLDLIPLEYRAMVLDEALSVLPAHRDMVLDEASQAILDHADEHFPADGNDEQQRMRRHLRVAARIVTPEWRRHLAATTPPTRPSEPQTAERAEVVPQEAPEAQRPPEAAHTWVPPEDRDKAKAAIHPALHSLYVRIVGIDGDCHCNLIAEVVLDALATTQPPTTQETP